MIEPFAKDRLADLLGTCCPHAAFGLLELNTGWLESKTAEIENAPHIALEVVNDVLAAEPDNPPREHAIEVLHQLEISPVIARDVLNAAASLPPVGEQLLQITEAARHRLAPGIDNTGVGQYQVNQADMPEVVWHLANEVRLGGATDLGITQVFFAQPQIAFGLHIREHAQVTWVVEVGNVPLQTKDDPRNSSLLLRTLDPGMRGENLLQKR
ncbi:MAG: hypothetical protein WA446_07690 [Steroidobacteraceae bacterium]